MTRNYPICDPGGSVSFRHGGTMPMQSSAMRNRTVRGQRILLYCTCLSWSRANRWWSRRQALYFGRTWLYCSCCRKVPCRSGGCIHVLWVHWGCVGPKSCQSWATVGNWSRCCGNVPRMWFLCHLLLNSRNRGWWLPWSGTHDCKRFRSQSAWSISGSWNRQNPECWTSCLSCCSH